MKRFAIACIIALTLCAGCESSGNTGEKSAVTSHTEKVAETTVEAVTTEESTEENTTEEVTTTATKTDDKLTVTVGTEETTAVENVSTTVKAENAETVTTTTKSGADNTKAVDTPVTTNNLPDVENFVSFEELEEGENSDGENVDIPENITGNEESQDDTDSGVIELPFVPFG